MSGVKKFFTCFRNGAAIFSSENYIKEDKAVDPSFTLFCILNMNITPNLDSDHIKLYRQFWAEVKFRKSQTSFSVWKNLEDRFFELSNTTKSLLSAPPDENVWIVLDDGTLSLLEGARLSKTHIHGLLFVIYHFFRPLGYRVNGSVELVTNSVYGKEKLLKIEVKDNVVCLEKTASNPSRDLVRDTNIWDPKESDVEVRRIILDIMRSVFEQSGLKGWKVSSSNNDVCLVDPVQKIMYLSDRQLSLYTRKFGVKGLINLVKARVAQLGSA